MQILFIALCALFLLVTAYFTYGRWLSRKIFSLNKSAQVPSIALQDDVDFVPTKRSVVFGHHFTSIAGTGPIVGPALAVMWGWLPALVWVLLGSIFIGAVHDFGSLVVSLRNRGQTVGDIAARLLNRRVRFLFLSVLFMALTIVLAIFGLVIASVFRMYPTSILPCLVQIPIAVFIGVWLHNKGVNLLLPSLFALSLMYVTVLFGDVGPLHAINSWLAGLPIIAWVVLLLLYSYVASVLPVWVLLQPRDYINSLQLLTALGLIVVGLAVAAVYGGAPIEPGTARPALEMVAPSFRPEAPGAPNIWPFLFITIACGACSGFHCLVSSGTSSKQICCETDAQMVGYGAMLTEGFLSVVVILACAAGIGLGIQDGNGSILTGKAAYLFKYGTWQSAGTLGAKIGAFVSGAANFLMALGISSKAAVALIGVLVASFAGTTLDTACRLQRYIVQELARACQGESTQAKNKNNSSNAAPNGPLGWLQNKHGATIFAVILAAAIATLAKPGVDWNLQTAGTGGLILWPLFGATNQLLAGMAFLIIAFYLRRRNISLWFVALPMLFMLLMPAWAMLQQLPAWLHPKDPNLSPNWVVISIAIATLVLETWIVIEALLLWPRIRGIAEEPLPDAVECPIH